MRDDSELALLSPPTDTCYICGMAYPMGENGVPLASPADTCSRCGATGGDVRLLLRAGAKAYGQARDAALAYRFEDAREHLRVASSLGLSQSAAWWELSRLVGKSDPAVSAREAADYALAHHLAKIGSFDSARELRLPQTPAVIELHRLCKNAQTQTRQQYSTTIVKYALWGAFCVFLVAICRC